MHLMSVVKKLNMKAIKKLLLRIFHGKYPGEELIKKSWNFLRLKILTKNYVLSEK